MSQGVGGKGQDSKVTKAPIIKLFKLCSLNSGIREVNSVTCGISGWEFVASASLWL